MITFMCKAPSGNQQAGVLAFVGGFLISAGGFAAITVSTVPVGDVGNAGYSTGKWGAVSYAYNIGKYEVTAGQYAAFLNAVARTDTNGLYNPGQASTVDGSGITRSGTSGSYVYSVDADFVNRPVNFVSFWDATRFANWLHNGQPTGDQSAGTTEDGAYTLTASGMATNTIARNAGAHWVLCSEDEWYKAAYYIGGSLNAGYWDYPTRTNAVPGNDLADVSGNNTNCHISGTTYPIDSGKYTTVVGQFFRSAGPYGTFDQGGNVGEWTEEIGSGSVRVLRGLGYNQSQWGMDRIYLDSRTPDTELSINGFRMAEVPEPSSLAIVILGACGMLSRQRSGHGD